MRALGASQRVMAIISSAETPATPGANNSSANLEIAGGDVLGERVAGRVVFKVRGRGRVGQPLVGGSVVSVMQSIKPKQKNKQINQNVFL